MIKNIILDIGGVIFDDSKKNIEKLLKKNCDNIYSKAYGKGFKQVLLGEMTIKELLDSLRNEYEFNDIKYILDKNNLKKSYPIIKDNYEYIKTLKQRGYNLYLLSNITEDSYNYINDLINIDETFKGGVYSYQENIVKPNYEIYNLILSKYNLKKEETIFFDDKEKNVKAANEVGLNSYVFNTIEDIEKKINSNIPITELIKRELLKRTKNSKDKDGFDFWEDHIKYVVEGPWV